MNLTIDKRKRGTNRVMYRVVYGVKLTTKMIIEELKYYNRFAKVNLSIPEYLSYVVEDFIRERAPDYTPHIFPTFFGSLTKNERDREWFLSLIEPTYIHTISPYLIYDDTWVEVDSPVDKLILKCMFTRFNTLPEQDFKLQLYIGYVYI